MAIGTILAGVGLGTSLLGNLFGMSKSAKAANKRQRRLDQAAQENEAWYKRNYYQDPTQRADAQRMLTLTQEAIRQRNQASAGRQAVMGGTGEGRAADMAANNAMYGDAVGRIVAANDQRKDRVDDTYRRERAAILNKQADTEYQKAQSLAQGVADIGNSLMQAGDILAQTRTSRSGSSPKIRPSSNPMEDYGTPSADITGAQPVRRYATKTPRTF